MTATRRTLGVCHYPEHWPERFTAILADSDAKAAKGALAIDRRDLSRLIGRPTPPMRDTLKTKLS